MLPGRDHSGWIGVPHFITCILSAGDHSAAGSRSAARQAESKTRRRRGRESLLDLPELSDRVIQLAVEDELLRSAAVDGHLIDVDVAESVVTLSGRLNNILAEQIAVGLANVSAVSSRSLMKSKLLSTAATTRNSRRRCWQRLKPIRSRTS